jgi:hypothetical protein
VLLFAAAQVVVLALTGAGLAWWFAGPEHRSALVGAGVLAFAVQTLTFTIVRLVAQEQVIAAWGVGVLVRFAVVAAWAFVLVPALGLSPSAALFALVAYFFVSTVVEPIFLNI